ncbi:MAG: FAD:protein FMN transferase [Anaerolineae bacterium]
MIATAEYIKTKTTTPDWRWNARHFRAMNTDVHAILFSQSDEAVLSDVERLFASFERRLSRFLPDSELSQLNRATSFKASPTLFNAVEVALWAAEMTGGLYDPTLLAQLEQAGYNRTFEQVEHPLPLSPADINPAATATKNGHSAGYNFHSVRLDRARQQIHKPHDVKLDLGGMGKGWAVDRTADRLLGLGPFMINAGGDIFVYQSPPGEKGWMIDVVHPFRPGHFIAQLQLNHQALATSTIARRRWHHNGQVMHHLIDPRTGVPAQTDAVSVTVVASRTTLAEVYAKVALILGVDEGINYLQQLSGVEGLIYTAGGEIVFTGNLTPLISRLSPEGYQ